MNQKSRTKRNIGISSIIYTLIIITSLAQFFQALLMREIVNQAEVLDLEQVKMLFILIVLTMIVEVPCSFIGSYIRTLYKTKHIHEMRMKLMSHITHSDYETLANKDKGNMVSIIMKDLEVWGSRIESLFSLGNIPVKIILTLVACFMISYKVTLCLMILLPTVMLIGGKLGERTYRYQLQQKEETGVVNDYLLNMLSFLEVIKTYNLKHIFMKKNREYLQNLFHANMKLLKHQFLVVVFNRVVGMLPYAILFGVGGVFALLGELELGDILALSFLVGFLGEGINDLTNYITVSRSYKASYQRVQEILSMPYEEEQHTWFHLKPQKQDIIYDLRDVTFSYGREQIIRNATFQIKRGEKVALYGQSGCGKSTILKLLSKLYVPDEGALLFCNKNIKEISVQELRDSLAAYLQESILFPGSIRWNMTLAQREKDGTGYMEITKKMELNDVIDQCELGHETMVAEGGKNFSRGQLQRIALARVFNKEAPVYLLDEPTSALDIKTEKKIFSYFLSKSFTSTVVCVLQSEEYLKYFDKVIYMKEGEVVEERIQIRPIL